MKLKHPKIGDKRIVTFFLFFPLRIGDESRWLETATYEEEFKITRVPETDLPKEIWVPVRWIDIP